MRWIWPVLAVVATGCFDPVLHPGQPCAPPPERCPGDLVCIDDLCVDTAPTRPDATDGIADARLIDATPASDSDGDGVVDPDDNCVGEPNPDQYDEDADLLGDACDLCPHVVDPGQPDADGDKVGDACDPHPTNGADQWVAFEGWNGTAAPAGWMLDGGWTVSGGMLHSADDATASEGRAIYGTSLQRAYVTTRIEIIAVDPGAGGTYRSAGVITSVSAFGEYRCLVRDTPTTPTNAAILRDNTTLTGTNLAGAVLGSVNTISLEDRGTTLTCDGQRGANGWSDSTTDPIYLSGNTGVRTQHAVATFDYIAIIQPAP